MEEEQKFLDYIAPDAWPTEMDRIRENLLGTIQLDDELTLNHGNKEVLPSLLNAYKRHFPKRFQEKELKTSEQQKFDGPGNVTSDTDVDNVQQVEEHQLDESSRTPSVDVNSNPVANLPQAESKNDGDECTPPTSDLESPQGKVTALKEKGIECHNMKWEQFLSEVWDSSKKRIDAIITNPPLSPSLSFIQNEQKRKRSTESEGELTSSDIIAVVKGGKRLLKPGGYFIVMVDFEMFQEWYLAFKANGYNVMKKLHTFSYKQDLVPRRPADEEYFPFGVEEYCVVARVPGIHPEGFFPNFQSSFILIECTRPKMASIVTNVEMPKNRLCEPNSRKPLRMSEKPVDLLAEITD